MSDETTGPSPEEMGLTPEDMKIEKPETKPEKGVEMPTYNPDDQIKLKEGDDYLSVVGTEKTRAGRDIGNKIREFTKDWKEPLGAIPSSGFSPRFHHFGGAGLQWAVDNTSEEVGMKFSAHGIAKIPVENLERLVTEGINKDQTFYSMSFIRLSEAAGAAGAEMPKTEGGLIVVSDYDKIFPHEGDPQIKYILVDEQYMKVVDIMQERYAGYGIKVVPWHDVPKVFTEDYNSHNLGNEIKSLVAPDSESPLRYEFGGTSPGLEKSGPVDTVQAVSSDEIDPDESIVY